jgi:hypothetical protein
LFFGFWKSAAVGGLLLLCAQIGSHPRAEAGEGDDKQSAQDLSHVSTLLVVFSAAPDLCESYTNSLASGTGCQCLLLAHSVRRFVPLTTALE